MNCFEYGKIIVKHFKSTTKYSNGEKKIIFLISSNYTSFVIINIKLTSYLF